MNTPAHVIVSALALGRGQTRKNWLSIIMGALLPDLPMVAFYFYQRLGVGQVDQLIWSQIYFEPHWQQFFDLFNSLPLIAVGTTIALARKSRVGAAFFLSMALHVALDLPVHREDAHGHFFPFSNWRFESPVSYWDPAHYGFWFGAVEALGVVVGCIILIRRGQPWRVVGIGTLAIYVAFGLFVVRYWIN